MICSFLVPPVRVETCVVDSYQPAACLESIVGEVEGKTLLVNDADVKPVSLRVV